MLFFNFKSDSGWDYLDYLAQTIEAGKAAPISERFLETIGSLQAIINDVQFKSDKRPYQQAHVDTRESMRRFRERDLSSALALARQARDRFERPRLNAGPG